MIYISIRFATASHLCGCGCGNEVVTPLRPTDWKLIFDGKTISLYPSIGNWSFPCQSHYWIRHNAVQWDLTWSQQEVDLARAYDRLKGSGTTERNETTVDGPSQAGEHADEGTGAQRRSGRWLDRLRMSAWW